MSRAPNRVFLPYLRHQDPSQLSQLLRRRAGSRVHLHFTDPVTHHDVHTTHIVATAERHTRLAQHHDIDTALHSPLREATRRVRFDSRHVTPTLLKHVSAPTSTTVVMEHTSNMYDSFDGINVPGDTQADPDLFKAFTNGLLDSNGNLGNSQKLHNPLVQPDTDPPTDDIEMLSSPSQRSEPNTSPSIFNQDIDKHALREYPEFRTPRAAGGKRDSQAQVLSSAIKTNTTPGTVLSASAFFGFGDAANGNAMSLTQAFNATQAKTSPLAGAPNEDVVFQRPSPNFTNMRQSSPGVSMSSPMKRYGLKEAATGPGHGSIGDANHEGASALGDGLSKPALRPSRSQSSSPDELSQEYFPMTKTFPAAIPGRAGRDQRIQVPHTSSCPPRTLSGQPTSNISQPATPLSQLQRGSQIRASASQPLPKSITNLRSSKESEIVMDSQPDATAATPSLQPFDVLRYPSSPSVNQYSVNQTTMISRTGYTSPLVSSLVPLPPPRSSSQGSGNAEKQETLVSRPAEGVPSSPPVVAQDEEITYDEHAYDEGSDNELERSTTSSVHSYGYNNEDLSTTRMDAEPDTKNGRGLADKDVNNPHNDDSGSETVKQKYSEVASPEKVSTRSLHDIANLPDTQRSTDFSGIDMPQLSFIADAEEDVDTFVSHRPSTTSNKRRKLTYSTKKGFRGPIQETDPPDELSTPPGGITAKEGWSPPLSQGLEPEGALSEEQAEDGLVNAQLRASKSRLQPEPTQTCTPRKGALKAVSRASFNKSLSKTPTKAITNEEKTAHTIPMLPIREDDRQVGIADVDSLKEVKNLPSNANGSLVRFTNDDGENPSGELLVSQRCFAYWSGSGQNFYPATCIGRSGSHHFRVRYDDGNEKDLDAAQVRALSLRPGDHVKINIPRMKKQVYVVVGFKNKINIKSLTIQYPLTDQYGYATVVLEEKQRESLVAPQERAKKHIEVPMSELYLTAQLWGRIRDRFFTYAAPHSSSSPVSRSSTPVALSFNTHTPNTSRQSTKGTSLFRGSTARAASVTSSERSASKTFFNMAFAITFTNESLDKVDMAKRIASCGGIVIEDGFYELFDTEAENALISSSEGTATGDLDGLVLHSEFGNLGFVALISDSHSRRTKYIEALALNVPCLHWRWVYDSLSASRALPFAKYLLPAGTSTFLDLGGVVRSRGMAAYDPADEHVTFKTMLKERHFFLRKQPVLVVTIRAKKAKNELERKSPYMFLMRAMGAACVTLCGDFSSARNLIKDGKFEWVCVDGKAETFDDTSAKLLGCGDSKSVKKKAGDKRRMEDRMEGGSLFRAGLVGSNRVRVMSGEFVIQSLILGALLEE